MRAFGVVVATALAIALQSTLAQFVIRGTVAVDLVLVVVVYAALVAGPVTGLGACNWRSHATRLIPDLEGAKMRRIGLPVESLIVTTTAGVSSRSSAFNESHGG